MPKITQDICAQCGQIKKQTNNWLIASTRLDLQMTAFTVYSDKLNEGEEYICGRTCALKWLNKELDKITKLENTVEFEEPIRQINDTFDVWNG